jgi:hypothetical protein
VAFHEEGGEDRAEAAKVVAIGEEEGEAEEEEEEESTYVLTLRASGLPLLIGSEAAMVANS